MGAFRQSRMTANIAILIVLIVIRMSRYWNSFLRCYNRIAFRTTLTFGQTCACTCRANCAINDLCMSKRIYTTHFLLAAFANSLLYTSRETGGRINNIPRAKSMLVRATAKNECHGNGNSRNSSNHTTDDKRQLRYGGLWSGNFCYRLARLRTFRRSSTLLF